jgi:hypothetical protein
MWVEMDPSVLAYVPAPGSNVTLEQIAAFVSANPEAPAALAEINGGVARTAAVPNGQTVLIPADLIDRPAALRSMPRRMREKLLIARRVNADNRAFTRSMQPRSAHPMGPGAVGLIPVTTEAMRQLALGMGEAGMWALAFVGGVVHGFVKSIWDTVAGLAHLIVDIVRLIYKVITDLRGLAESIRKMSLDALKEALGEWISEWVAKLTSKDPWVSGHAWGYAIGYIAAEVLMLVFTGGVATEVKGIVMSSRIVKLVANSRAVTEIAKGLKPIARGLEGALKLGRAARAGLGTAVTVLRQSRVRALVTAAQAAGTAVVWTARRVTWALHLPGFIARYVTEKILRKIKVLEPYFERIEPLSVRAKRHLFGCHSPCDKEPEEVAEKLASKTNDEIEAEAAEASRHQRQVGQQQQQTKKQPPEPPEASEGSGLDDDDITPPQGTRRRQPQTPEELQRERKATLERRKMLLKAERKHLGKLRRAESEARANAVVKSHKARTHSEPAPPPPSPDHRVDTGPSVQIDQDYAHEVGEPGITTHTPDESQRAAARAAREAAERQDAGEAAVALQEQAKSLRAAVREQQIAVEKLEDEIERLEIEIWIFEGDPERPDTERDPDPEDE